MEVDYSTVTEIAGEDISQEQLERLYHRYYWAGNYCEGKDVVEVACGTAFRREFGTKYSSQCFTTNVCANSNPAKHLGAIQPRPAVVEG